MAKGLASRDGGKLVEARADRPFADLQELQRRTGLGVGALERLAAADAFHALGLARRDALWAIRALRDTALPLFAAAEAIAEPAPALKPATAGREVVEDYGSVGLSLKAHPLAFLRQALARRGVTPAAGLARLQDGQQVKVAGLVLVRQRPGSAKGVMFVTLEDETGPLNVIVWPSLFERFRRTVFSAGMMGVAGKLQREASVIHVVALRLVDLSPALRRLGERGTAFPLPLGRADEARTGGGVDQRTREKRPLGPAPRDIYTPDLPHRRGQEGIRVRPRNFR